MATSGAQICVFVWGVGIYIYMNLYKKAANISTPHNVRELYPSWCYSSIFVYLLRV